MFPQTRQCKKHSLNSFLKLAKTKNALRHQSCNVNACGDSGIDDEEEVGKAIYQGICVIERFQILVWSLFFCVWGNISRWKF